MGSLALRWRTPISLLPPSLLLQARGNSVAANLFEKANRVPRMKALALLVLGSVFSAVGASELGCEPGSGSVTVQDDCDSAGAALSIDRLEDVRDACGSTNIALECKELASGAFAIVIASGQAGSTSSKRKQVLAGKLFLSFFFPFPFPCSFSH